MPKKRGNERITVNLAPPSEHDDESEQEEFDEGYPSGSPARSESGNRVKDVSGLLDTLFANGASVRGTVDQDGKISFEFHASPKGEGKPARPTKEVGSYDPPPRYETRPVSSGSSQNHRHQAKPRGFFFR